MCLVMRASNPLRRLRVPHYRLGIPSLCSCAWQMVLGAAAGRIALLDILYAGGPERIWEHVLGNAVSSTCSRDV